MSVVWFNGSLMDASHAMVPALDRGVVWGDGLFETLRVYGGRPWAVPEHLARLREGSATLDLPVPDDAQLGGAIDAVVSANGFTDCGTRITVTRGEGPPDPHADATGPPNTLVTAWPLRDYSAFYEHGVALITMTGCGRALSHVKTTSYAVSLAGRVAARRAGVDDALFIGPDGLVLETTGSNLFAVFGEDLVTPPVADGVLPGVTRGYLLRIAADAGLTAREESVWLPELFGADEVLLTSTLREVYGVRSIDGRAITTEGGWGGRLRERYGTFVRGS